jgi:hypothetical protein
MELNRKKIFFELLSWLSIIIQGAGFICWINEADLFWMGWSLFWMLYGIACIIYSDRLWGQ